MSESRYNSDLPQVVEVPRIDTFVAQRLGLGTLRITGNGAWGPPADRDAVQTMLKRAVELGVTLIDTADAYGPEASELQIAAALHPYPDRLVIVTKGGYERPGRHQWRANGSPRHLRLAVEGSLRRLRLDCIDLYLLHAPDPYVPLEESLGALARLQEAGKIRYIGLSNVDVEHIHSASQIVPIAAVQNRYHLLDRTFEDVVSMCEQVGCLFMAHFPLAKGKLAQVDSGLRQIAERHNATSAQIALAWLLQRSPVLCPIPGTSSVRHLEENMGALKIQLSQQEFAQLSKFCSLRAQETMVSD
jgi:aryl-alcohol dehydrogenase-like predicted oxidoreductase